MIEIVWEFIVKEEACGLFELAYGPGGEWSKLLARCQGFRGTTLIRDTKNPQRYLTIDFWDSEALREQMLAERKSEYADLDAIFVDWTDSKCEVGIFKVLNEATVHPTGRAGRSRARSARRRGHRTTR